MVSYDCCVSLPHGATGLSAVCDCGISCIIIRTYSTIFYIQFLLFLFVCFVALRPKSTAMVTAGRSVHLTTLFPEQA